MAAMLCGLRYDEDNRLLPIDAPRVPLIRAMGPFAGSFARNPCRRPGESRDPALKVESWIPACAGMTMMMRGERYSECIPVVVSNKPQAVHQRFWTCIALQVQEGAQEGSLRSETTAIGLRAGKV